MFNFQVEIEGLTGEIRFNDDGRRHNYTLHVVEMTVNSAMVKVNIFFTQRTRAVCLRPQRPRPKCNRTVSKFYNVKKKKGKKTSKLSRGKTRQYQSLLIPRFMLFAVWRSLRSDDFAQQCCLSVTIDRHGREHRCTNFIEIAMWLKSY